MDSKQRTETVQMLWARFDQAETPDGKINALREITIYQGIEIHLLTKKLEELTGEQVA